MRFSAAVTYLTICIIAVSPAVAQPADWPLLTPEDRAAIIDTTAKLYAREYLFPDVGNQMAEHIRKQFQEGRYDSLATPPEFTSRLTEELRSISHDGHVSVRTLPPDAAEAADNDSARDAAQEAQELEYDRYLNFGFEKVERFKGNVGYIKLDEFASAEKAGATAIAAMNFVCYCDALIFDLRENGGGWPSMIQLITSYLFESPQHLNSFEIRGQDTPKQFWTQAYVIGPRLSDVPIYVLTSGDTYSGAEEFSYNLQNMKRATIIGETTGGGAHDTDAYAIYDLGIEVRVPHARAVNPISGTNWEGTGVKPDIECPTAKALDVAYVEALKKLKSRARNSAHEYALDWAIEGVEARLNPMILSRRELKVYTGTYGPRVLTLVGDTLFYRRGDRPKRRLIPLSKHRFALDGTDYVRFEFVPDANGNITEIVGHYEGGYTDRHKRSQ
jgi:hypothetical protein